MRGNRKRSITCYVLTNAFLFAQVIRDYKTKESLQYAFIEFETSEQCEAAFMKMDNVRTAQLNFWLLLTRFDLVRC